MTSCSRSITNRRIVADIAPRDLVLFFYRKKNGVVFIFFLNNIDAIAGSIHSPPTHTPLLPSFFVCTGSNCVAGKVREKKKVERSRPFCARNVRDFVSFLIKIKESSWRQRVDWRLQELRRESSVQKKNGATHFHLISQICLTFFFWRISVSRLHCESESFKMDLILDINSWLFPMDLGNSNKNLHLIV